jgi:hypothetical protein
VRAPPSLGPRPQLGWMHGQRESLSARACARDQALTHLAMSEGEVYIELSAVRSQLDQAEAALAAERAANAALLARLEQLGGSAAFER